MVIAGAGGHALEIFDVLLTLNYTSEEIAFYDDYGDILELNKCIVLKNEGSLIQYFKINPSFCLGVGKPELRKKLYERMLKAGGKHFPVVSPLAFISPTAQNYGADIMPFCFVSSKSELGLGTLINTRANVHHEVNIGEFNEVSPSANLLGQVIIKDFNSLGAGATILPKINVGSKNIIGAGAIITRNVDDEMKLKGVPAK